MRYPIIFGLLLVTLPAWAENEPYNRVDLQVEVGREIPNDLLLAQLSVEFQDKSPAQLAQHINSAINAALKKAANYSAVKTSSGAHSTYPVYGKNNRLESWRGNARLRLESRDFKAASELISQLQNTMLLAGVTFAVAPDTRQQAENSLVSEAIYAFDKRADAVRAALNGEGYKFVHLNINSSGNQYPQPVLARMAVADTVTAPEFAGSDSRITVQVSGTIEIVTKQK